eukprot:5866-Heterococcus_DN1.PRE.2
MGPISDYVRTIKYVKQVEDLFSSANQAPLLIVTQRKAQQLSARAAIAWEETFYPNPAPAVALELTNTPPPSALCQETVVCASTAAGAALNHSAAIY